MPEDTNTGGDLDVVEQPIDTAEDTVDTTGTITNPTQYTREQTIAFAKSYLAEEGFEVKAPGQSKQDTVRGTDIPTEFCTQDDWDDLDLASQKVLQKSWDMAKRMAQSTMAQTQKASTPFLREAAIVGLSEGLTATEVKALRKNIAELEAETGESFIAPEGGFKPSIVKLYQKAAKETAREMPPEKKTTVAKEPQTDAKPIDLTPEEKEVYDDWHRLGYKVTPERVREILKGRTNSHSGYIMEPTEA